MFSLYMVPRQSIKCRLGSRSLLRFAPEQPINFGSHPCLVVGQARASLVRGASSVAENDGGNANLTPMKSQKYRRKNEGWKKKKATGEQMHGWIVIDKGMGLRSSEVTQRIKDASRAAKVGHGGTLDPSATGVLPIALGQACGLFDDLMGRHRKTYTFTIRFGYETTTDDAEGERRAMLRNDDGSWQSAPVATTSSTTAEDSPPTTTLPSLKEVHKALEMFVGRNVLQVPPDISAVRVNGRRAHELARSGIAFTLEPKPVNIYRLRIMDDTSSDNGATCTPSSSASSASSSSSLSSSREERLHETTETDNNSLSSSFSTDRVEEVDLEVTCGSGTYVRSIARDLGRHLGCLGHVRTLRRTESGPFHQRDAMSLDEVERMFAQWDRTHETRPEWFGMPWEVYANTDTNPIQKCQAVPISELDQKEDALNRARGSSRKDGTPLTIRMPPDVMAGMKEGEAVIHDRDRIVLRGKITPEKTFVVAPR